MYFTRNSIYVTEMSELLAREWEHDNAIVQVMYMVVSKWDARLYFIQNPLDISWMSSLHFSFIIRLPQEIDKNEPGILLDWQ